MFHINFLERPYTVKNIPRGKPSPLLHHHHLPPSLALQVSNASLTRCNSSVPVLITHLPTLIYTARSSGVALTTVDFSRDAKLTKIFLTGQTIIPNNPEALSAPSAAPNHHRHQLMPEQALSIPSSPWC